MEQSVLFLLLLMGWEYENVLINFRFYRFSINPYFPKAIGWNPKMRFDKNCKFRQNRNTNLLETILTTTLGMIDRAFQPMEQNKLTWEIPKLPKRQKFSIFALFCQKLAEKMTKIVNARCSIEWPVINFCKTIGLSELLVKTTLKIIAFALWKIRNLVFFAQKPVENSDFGLLHAKLPKSPIVIECFGLF